MVIGMVVVESCITKKERVAVKYYIDDVYSVNGAVFLEVNDKKKVRKAIERRSFDMIISRNHDLIILPYHEGNRFYNFYEEYLTNKNWKPSLWNDVENLVDLKKFKLFTKTMIIRQEVKHFSMQNKSLMYMLSLLLAKIGLTPTINLRHQVIKFRGNGWDGRVLLPENCENLEFTKEYYDKYGWLFKFERLNEESPFYYTIRGLSNFMIPIFLNLKYSKNNNYITTEDNYEQLLSFEGTKWLTRVAQKTNAEIGQIQSFLSGQEKGSVMSQSL